MIKHIILYLVFSSCLVAQISVLPERVTLCPGDYQQFTSSPAAGGWSLLPSAPDVSISSTGLVTIVEAATPKIVTVMATGPAGVVGVAHVVIDSSVCTTPNEARAVIGFEQAGASATKAEQHFFFDFFIDRRMAAKWFSIWGNVRVASYPQQITTPLAQFDLATQLGQVPVNQLAETAEFSTGIDIHPFKNWAIGGKTTRRFGFIAGVGANGPFTPRSRLSIFQVPDTTSPQYPSFVATYPAAKGATYVGFLPPDRQQFYRSWEAGFRLTTVYPERGAAVSFPATYSVTFGQDETVTGGQFGKAVGKVDVFYPLPIKRKNYQWLFLFGNAALRLTRAHDSTPFVLAPAPSCTGTPSSTCVNITGSEPSVAIIALPSTRDWYRIGVGLDAVAVICAIHSAWCHQ